MRLSFFPPLQRPRAVCLNHTVADRLFMSMYMAERGRARSGRLVRARGQEPCLMKSLMCCNRSALTAFGTVLRPSVVSRATSSSTVRFSLPGSLRIPAGDGAAPTVWPRRRACARVASMGHGSHAVQVAWGARAEPPLTLCAGLHVVTPSAVHELLLQQLLQPVSARSAPWRARPGGESPSL